VDIDDNDDVDNNDYCDGYGEYLKYYSRLVTMR